MEEIAWHLNLISVILVFHLLFFILHSFVSIRVLKKVLKEIAEANHTFATQIMAFMRDLWKGRNE